VTAGVCRCAASGTKNAPQQAATTTEARAPHQLRNAQARLRAQDTPSVGKTFGM
jgi:hypothetical protein